MTQEIQPGSFTVTFEADLPGGDRSRERAGKPDVVTEVEIGTVISAVVARVVCFCPRPAGSLVIGNRFDSSGSAILIAGDAKYWYESGGVRDCLIARQYVQ